VLIGNEETKLSLLTDDMIFYAENLNDFPKQKQKNEKTFPGSNKQL
jgi:hypothetical protein